MSETMGSKRHISTRRLYKLVLLLTAVAGVVFILRASSLHDQSNQIDIVYNISEFIYEFSGEPRSESPPPRLFLFNTSRNLEPVDFYESIKCRRSLHIYVSTMLCIYNIHQDIHVSASINYAGIWEPDVLNPFLDYVNDNRDYLIIDLGAQIGQYTLFAAKMGRQVIAVDPFIENLFRIHKAASIENTRDRITLVYNAVSNKRNKIMSLIKSSDNIGGQTLNDVQEMSIDKWRLLNNKYLTSTIYLDDLLYLIPNTTRKRKAIIKIDVEGYEAFVFERAESLFTSLDIEVVFMEWGNLVKKEKELKTEIERLIDFLSRHGYSPYAHLALLDIQLWITWPWDITWRKNYTRKPYDLEFNIF